MPIYWSILGVTAFLGVLSYYFPRPQSKLNTDSGQSTAFFRPFYIRLYYPGLRPAQ